MDFGSQVAQVGKHGDFLVKLRPPVQAMFDTFIDGEWVDASAPQFGNSQHKVVERLSR